MYTPKGELNDKLLKIMQDPEMIKEFEGLTAPEEGLKVAQKYIPGMTLQEFQQNMQTMNAYLEESQNGLLTDDDLDCVAGGKDSASTIAAALGAVGGVAGAIGSVVSALAFTS